MPSALAQILGSLRPLIVVATAREAGAIPGFGAGQPVSEWTRLEWAHADVVISGVGKANAAAAVARTLDPARHGLVLSVGIAGALPGAGGAPPSLTIGSVVCADRCVYADEGILTPEGFTGGAAMGFALGPFDDRGVQTLPALRTLAAQHGALIGPVATVSTCSGTDALARAVAQRTGAIAEAMEGAAAAHAAARLGVAAAEVRAISNTTGDRARQRWDIGAALDSLNAVLGRILT